MVDRGILETVHSRIQELLPEITELRHALHAHPEIGIDTYATRESILQALRGTSFAEQKSLLGADLIGEIRGNSDRRICLRADMDALPIVEEGDSPYKSTYSGRMHACGHDGHTAMLVGAVKVLDSIKDSLPVTVRFVFQPGEETYCAGAKMVEMGACDGCEAAYAIHGWSGIPVGTIQTKKGVMFASGAHLNAKLVGKGCHGAMPEKGNNPIPVGARVVDRLAALHSMIHAEDGSVVSVCAFQAGEGSNVIPDYAVIRGTARYLEAQRGDVIERAIRDAFEEETSRAGMCLEMEYSRDYNLPVINTAKGYDMVRKVVEENMSPGTFQDLQRPTMGMEDFAYYLQDREGAMVFLGLGETCPPLHSPIFDFNDEVLSTGILLHTLLALSQ